MTKCGATNMRSTNPGLAPNIKMEDISHPYCATAVGSEQQTMAAVRALKAAKRDLRKLMKERLSSIPQESVENQSMSTQYMDSMHRSESIQARKSSRLYSG